MRSYTSIILGRFVLLSVLIISNFLYIIIIKSSMQANWDDYGIDYDGPVSLDDDQDAVTVEEISDLLSDVQKDALTTELERMGGDSFSQLEMLSKYTVAKTFVYNVCEI